LGHNAFISLSGFASFLQMNLKAVPLPKPEELKQFSGIIADKDVPVLVSAIKGRAHLAPLHLQRLKIFSSTFCTNVAFLPYQNTAQNESASFPLRPPIPGLSSPSFFPSRP
jgi:hypothetical protein